jgi:membrane protease YdiL (CAAX protease family)
VVVAGAVVLALVAWAFIFRLPPDAIWPRTWFVAGVVGTYALVSAAVTGHLDTLVGPVDGPTVVAGLAVGVGWLVATHVGHRTLCRLFPSFLERVGDLYSLRSGDRVSTMVGPVTTMGIAEELLFRGTIQGRVGLAGAVAAYAAAQLVTGNWVLTLAAVLCGVVWGVLAWWTGGLVAPVIAHIIWTDALTFVWPLHGCAGRPGAADLAPVAHDAPEPSRLG